MADANVVISGVDHAETTAAVEHLRGTPPRRGPTPARVAGVAGNLTDTDFSDTLLRVAIDTFGHVDHLICNAGIDIIKPAIDYTIDEWERILTVNLRGAFQPAQTFARYWISTGHRGSITMTSSIAGQVGIPTLAPYAASKGGINQLVRTLAVEWAPHGIRVNAVAPGYVDNVMVGVTAHDDPASDQRIATFTPLGRRATPDEIAAPYVFLAAPAASYVTGSILAVDGGYSST